MDHRDFRPSFDMTELSLSPLSTPAIALHDAPIARTEDGHGLDDIPTETRYFQYEQGFRGYWVGPVGISEFLDLLPSTAKPTPDVMEHHFGVVPQICGEAKLAELLVCDLLFTHHMY